MYKFMKEILLKIENIGIIPVIKLKTVDQAIPLGKALIEGGIYAAEVTFRSDAAFEGIKTLKKTYPELLVGAGTVINTDYAKKAIEAGADFIVSPGFNPKVIEYVLEKKITVIPGVSSPSEIEQALEYGLEYLKFFPAENLGGVKMLKALMGPFPNIKFMVTGGISEDNVTEYLKCKNVFAIGGSWMVKDDLVAVQELSKKAVEKLHGFSFEFLGINSLNKDDAKNISNTLEIFGFIGKESNDCWISKKIESNGFFQVFKGLGPGQEGTIGIKTYSIERALCYLEKFNIMGKMSTAIYFNEENDKKIKSVFLDKSIGGFSIQLISYNS